MKLKLIIITFMTLMLSWHVHTQDNEQSSFSQAEILQMVAPLALYPDKLLSQILMACTYPLEIVSAARFAKANSNLTETALQDSLQKQPWDESVKSLVVFPQVLAMLNEKLDMTQRLGDAFLDQQKEVLAAIQELRKKAQDQGHLVSGQEQQVNTKQEQDSSYITIEPTDPETVYVPTYDTSSVYGSWPDDSYPPYSYYPSGYGAGAGISYGAGLRAGYALWGNVDWRDNRTYVDARTFNNFNRTNIADGEWRHRVNHRKGVGYRGKRAQEKYGKDQQRDIRSRDDFRGRDRAQQRPARTDSAVDRRRDRSPRAAQRDRSQRAPRSSMQAPRTRQGPRTAERSRQASAQHRSGAFDGVGHGGQTRNYSNRGKISRPTSNFGGGRSRSGGGSGRRGGGGGRRR